MKFNPNIRFAPPRFGDSFPIQKPKDTAKINRNQTMQSTSSGNVSMEGAEFGEKNFFRFAFTFSVMFDDSSDMTSVLLRLAAKTVDVSPVFVHPCVHC